MSSIRLKLAGPIFGLTSLLVVFLATYFPAKHIESIHREMRDKAAAYARLVSKQVEPGVAFDDRETVREVFDATAEDQDVRALALYDARGALLYGQGDLAGPPPSPSEGARANRAVSLTDGSALVRATSPVVSREGPTGTLIVELATDRADVAQRSIQRTAIGVGLAAILTGLVVAWAIGGSLARRVGAIATATRAVADGDLTARRIEDGSSDEIGQLARSFDRMFANIRELVDHIREANAKETERLDALVAQRTSELDGRTREMRLVLDNVNQGLFVVDRAGTMTSEPSAAIGRWLGAPAAGASWFDRLALTSPSFAEETRVGWGEVVAAVMPAELMLEQMPRRLPLADGSVLRVEYRPIGAAETAERFLVVVTDVTGEINRERAELERREAMAVFEHLMANRSGFEAFMREGETTVGALVGGRSQDAVVVGRWLHTLKGNASLYGLASIAQMCHGLEDRMAEERAIPAVQAFGALAERWARLAADVERLVGNRTPTVEVEERQYAALETAVRSGEPAALLLRRLRTLRCEPVSKRLRLIEEQAKRIGRRLGKGDLRVVIDDEGVRLDNRQWAVFWSHFIHAVRNAVDHGLESPAARIAAGKPAQGTLTFRAKEDGEQLVIEIADDGRGIDWAAVTARASAAGLPVTTQEDLNRALFHDGLTTATALSEISGRGVGMGALLEGTRMLGGEIAIRSVPGRGTTLRFSFPGAGERGAVAA